MSRGRQAAAVLAALAWASASIAAACSAPALAPDIAEAEFAAASGDQTGALRHYDAAVAQCGAAQTDDARSRTTCAQALMGRAELLEHSGQRLRAAAAYAAFPQVLSGDAATAAAGVYRAGRLYLELGQDRRGYQLLWRAVTDYPNQGYAGDALRILVRDGRQRNPGQLYRILSQLIQPLSGTGVADNVIYMMADLAQRELGEGHVARDLYDKITVEYPESGLRDDAFWHSARLSRELRDGHGAAARLRQLLDTREVAFGAGSYNSIWFDNAQLELGRVLRDDLNDHRAALEAFAQVPKDYPASVLIDDSMWEVAVTWDRLGDGRKTCAALSRLATWPDSKYQLERAPALSKKHQCAAGSGT